MATEKRDVLLCFAMLRENEEQSCRIEMAQSTYSAADAGSETDSTGSKTYRNIGVHKVVSFPATGANVITAVQYSKDGHFLVCGDVSGRMHIMAADTGAILRPVKHYKHGSSSIMCIRFHPVKKNSFLVSTANGTIQRCEATSGASQTVAIEIDNVTHCLDVSMTGSCIITVGKDLKVRIYDEVTMTLMRMIDGYVGTSAPDDMLVGHALRVFGLKCHPEYEHIFITGGWDNHLKVWDTRTEEGVVNIIQGPHICGDSIDIKGNYIVTGSWVKTNSLQLWDFKTMGLVRDIKFRHKGDGEYLYCAKFANEQMVLAGGSGTNSVQAINMQTDELVAEVKLGHAVLSVHSALDGRRFCVAGSSRHVKLCTMAD